MISVLYIDDEPELLTIGKLFIENDSGIHVDTALSAIDGLEQMKLKNYDAIIADYQMPGMDGIELLKFLRSSGNDVPFIIFTGRGREEIVIQALNEGADFYLQKGGDPVSQYIELGSKVKMAVGQRATERALKDSQKELSEIIEFLPDATIAVDKNKRVIIWNHATELMTGIPSSEMIGKGDYAYAVPFYGYKRPTLLDFIFDPDSIIFENYPVMRREGDSIRVEVFCPALNEGKGAYVAAKASLLRDFNGNLIGAIESVRDISHMKEAEEKIRQSEERYRNVVEDQTEIISRFLPDGTHVFVNDAYCRYFNINREDILGKRFQPNIPPADRKQLSNFLKSLDPGHPVDYIEHRIIMPDGTLRWQRWSDRAIFDELGNTVEYQSVGRDITDSKIIEARLHQSEEFVQKVIDGANEGIIVYDRELKVTLWNKFMENLTGVPASDIIGNSPIELFPFLDKAGVAGLLKDALAGSIGISDDFFFDIAKTGKSGWGRGLYSPYYNENKEIIGVIGIIQDRTRFKKSEDELRESEERYRVLFENANDAVYLLEIPPGDMPGKILMVNETACKILGYTRDELLGQLITFVSSEEHLLKIPAIAELSKRFGHGRFETKRKRKDGITFPVETSATRFELSGKTVAFAIDRDISERKRMEESLRIARDKYSKLFHGSPDAIMISDLNTGKVVEVNDATSHLFGYSRDNIIGKSEPELDIWPVRKEWDVFIKLMNTIGRVERAELTGRRDDGGLFNASVSADIIHIDGRMHIISVIRDITEDKIAEENRHENEAMIRALMDSPVDNILILDPDGIILDMNDAFRKRMGWAGDEQIGKCIYDLLPPDIARLRRAYESEVLTTKKPIRWEDQREGSWLDHSVYPISGAGGKITKIAIIARDIDDRKKLEETLLEANKQLKLLTSITRHDIQNKIMVILGILSLVKIEMKDPKIIGFLNTIETSALEISSQLEFTRTYQDLGTSEPLWIDLDSLLSRLSIPPEITLTAEIKGIMIFSDPMVEKVFSNLLDNSIRHGQYVTDIRVSHYLSGEDLILIWEDNGIGITDAEKNRIFDSNFGKNTAHGMFLAQEILSLTGITIKETGRHGKGVRFKVTVPKGIYRQ